MTPKDRQLLRTICTMLTNRFEEISPYKSTYTKEAISRSEIIEQLKDILDNGGIEVPKLHLGNIIKAAYTKFNKKHNASIYQLAMDLYNKNAQNPIEHKKMLQQAYIEKLRKSGSYDEASWLANQ